MTGLTEGRGGAAGTVAQQHHLHGSAVEGFPRSRIEQIDRNNAERIWSLCFSAYRKKNNGIQGKTFNSCCTRF
jgi:hypothetical protein